MATSTRNFRYAEGSIRATIHCYLSCNQMSLEDRAQMATAILTVNVNMKLLQSIKNPFLLS
jgi:hypothetical protein